MLSEEIKTTIQDAYRSYLANKQLSARYGQRHMLAQIARTLSAISLHKEHSESNRPIAVIEAGTGTGKTVGYLLSAIPMAIEHGKTLIVSTATVALQEQLIFKDVPDIIKNSGIDFKVALAKGRGRYLCTQNLDQRIQFYNGTVMNMSLFEETAQADELHLTAYEEFMSAFGSGDWSGDRDQWHETIDDKLWATITSSHRECLARRCPHFNSCPFYESRKEIDSADVIVTNHDLVLADLSLGGGAVLPPPEDSIYVFDEGHHLPDKALNHFSYSLAVNSFRNQLEAWNKQIDRVTTELAGFNSVQYLLEELAKSMHQCIEHVQALGSSIDPLKNQLLHDEKEMVFLDKDAIANTSEILFPVKSPVQLLLNGLFNIEEQLREEISKATDLNEKERLQACLPVVGRWLTRTEAVYNLLNSWTQQDEVSMPPMARWARTSNYEGTSDLIFNTSPVSAANLLRRNLWHRCGAAIVTSATLSVDKKFNRFSDQSGVPEHTDFFRVDSPFDYQNRVVAKVPEVAVEGNRVLDHTHAITEFIQSHLPKAAGNLILFSSRAQLNEVYDELDSDWQSIVMKQDDMPKTQLVEQHKSKLEQGGGSTLFGLASLAEGVDLPGNYLTNLVIAKIPFSVPDDPIQMTLGYWLEKQGINPFQKVTLPDAVIRTVQSCGRLIRQESDSGTIWFLDRRVETKFYGQIIRNSLPDYRWEIEAAH